MEWHGLSAELPPSLGIRSSISLSVHRDGDGVIYPSDTFKAFHDLGFNFFLSAIGNVFMRKCGSLIFKLLYSSKFAPSSIKLGRPDLCV